MVRLLVLVALVMLSVSGASCGGEEGGDVGEEPRVEADAGEVHEDCGCPE